MCMHNTAYSFSFHYSLPSFNWSYPEPLSITKFSVGYLCLSSGFGIFLVASCVCDLHGIPPLCFCIRYMWNWQLQGGKWMPLHFRGRIISCNYPKSLWENRVKEMRERKKKSMRENNHNTSTGLPFCVWKSITLTSPFCERCRQITWHLLFKVLLSREGDQWKDQSAAAVCRNVRAKMRRRTVRKSVCNWKRREVSACEKEKLIALNRGLHAHNPKVSLKLSPWYFSWSDFTPILLSASL